MATQVVDGKRVKVVRSGSVVDSPIPKPEVGRAIAHTHPTVNEFQKTASPQDMNILNKQYFQQLLGNPSAKPKPHRIIWGSGDADNTIVYPGFGKEPLPKVNPKFRWNK